MQSNAQNEPTRRAPTPPPLAGEPPPRPKSFAFLQPAQEADEIGRLGTYRVLRPLGEGGMAFLFLAEDLSLRRPVALKVMKPNLEAGAESWQRFMREAQLTARLRHDHLVTVFNAGQDGDACFFAMELLEGESLESRLRRSPGLSVRDIARIGREIATGLAVIHGSGLIHRDIKPSNLWLEAPEGRVKILDLGLARPLQTERNLTQTGLIVGTPAFMSPEQARGEPLDPRTDLFSLGCVLYSLCTGLHPFDGETTMAVLTALAVENPKPPHECNPAIPMELSLLVIRCLEKDRQRRPNSADEVAAELRRVESELSDAADLPVITRPAASDPDTENRPPRKSSSGTEAISRRSKKSKRRKKRVSGVKLWVPIIGLTMLLTAALTFAAVKVAGRLGGPPPDFPAPGSASIINANRVFVTDLTVIENHRLGRPPGGDRPPPPRPPPGVPPIEELEPMLQGRKLRNGIFMHPGRESPADMTYDLGGRFSTFRTEVSLNETVRGKPYPLTFRVYGDGNRLWQSKPVTSQADRQICDISVKGVNHLKLEVICGGEPRDAHGLWIDPRVDK